MQTTEKELITATKELMPVFFVSHSGPNLALDKDSYTKYLENFSKTIKKPEAIVIFSAHHEESVQTIGLVDKYPTIYDFSGFPKQYYEIKYNPPGDQDLAKEISDLFQKQGIKNKFDKKRGLDHGAWTVLMRMFPKADVPVASLSLNPDLDPSEMYKIGAALQPLREKGVLILASGALLHNFGLFDWNAGTDCKPAQWAKDFIQTIDKNLKEWKTEELFDYRKTKSGRDAAPTPEHFVPLFYAMGAGSTNKKATLLTESYWFKTGSYVIWRFD